MGAARKIKIFDAEIQEVSIASLRVAPELLQSRAETDPEIVHIYAERRRGKPGREGSPFPPVLVYFIAGIHWLADGFHRVKAAQRLGLASIPAIVREGTVLDALIAGAEINMSKENLRGYHEDDRRRYAELLIRCGAGKPGEGSWDWPDKQIAARAGIARIRVPRLRRELESQGVPVPVKVRVFREGRATPSWYSYRNDNLLRNRDGSMPKVVETPSRRGGRFRYRASVDGKDVYLGTDPTEAQRRLDEVMGQRQDLNAILRCTGNFSDWLARRGVTVRHVGPGSVTFLNLIVPDAGLILVPDPDAGAILQAVAQAVLARLDRPDINRAIIVGYFGGICTKGRAGRAVQLARKISPSIEFMTPEEVVAEFGPKGGDES